MKKSNRGGTRVNAGRKKKQKTVVVSARVPANKATVIKSKLTKIIDETV